MWLLGMKNTNGRKRICWENIFQNYNQEEKMQLKELNQKFKNQTWQENLTQILQYFENVTFSTSFSLEDQIITHFIEKNKLPIEVFTLDTGRLFKETYGIWQKTLDIYGIKIQAFYPDANQIGEFVSQNGIDAFYNSKELRVSCCQIRKVEPLKRALKGKDLWISGLRSGHSASRDDKDLVEKDKGFDITKFYPLLHLSEGEVWDYLKKNNVPFNKLYDSGFTSIGCAPCTRAIEDGEDPRAGRWWWEDSKKECGLHG
ncbi:MAG: phosphoadenosine phosphosulfate reductase [Rickettsiales bacterium]|jgi:phosphoadenosine phosphosulfate reductase